ncbi:MAG: DUF58 domain-containing protein [Actinomycetota bacterium]
MPSSRGLLVGACGIGLWVLAVLLGSPSVHVIAIGVLALPIITALLGRGTRHRLQVRRHLTEVRVQPGRRVGVEIDVTNDSAVSSSLVLLEDRMPSALGPSARLVLPGVHAHSRQRVRYSIAATARGRFRIGPITADLSDPFALTRRRLEVDDLDELVVMPEVEDLTGRAGAAFGHGAGSSRTRSLLRTGDEFFTMRQYQTGDDLRRIHWRSTARTGELMIRQDESTRRGQAVLLLDTRQATVGRSRDASFERCVSSAASVGVLLCRTGFGVRLATVALAPRLVNEEALLDALADVGDDPTRSPQSALTRVRAAAASDSTLVIVTAPPVPGELPSLLRTGAGFGPKLAVLVHPVEPASLPADRRTQLETRASQAHTALTRSGWDTVVLTPTMRLQDVWTTNDTPRSAGVSSR